jgi:hypothetical protein
MQETVNYTTLFAPVAFYLSGVVIVTLINLFIGKKTDRMK